MQSPRERAGAQAPIPTTRRPRSSQEWRLNRSLVLVSLAVGAVAAPIVYFWHGFQVRRQSTAIFARAMQLHEREDWNAAANAFHQYLQIRPNDAEALLMRARDFRKTVTRPEALPQVASLFVKAAEANPKDDDVLLDLAESLYLAAPWTQDRSGYLRQAAEAASKASAALPNEVRAARLYAGARREQLGQTGRNVDAKGVVNDFESALRRFPGDIPLSLGLIELLQTGKDMLPIEVVDRAGALADATLDAMVAAHPDDPDALLGRYRHRRKSDPAGADADLQHAREVAPESREVLQASLTATMDTDREAARKYAKRLLEVAPDNRVAYETVATMYGRWGDLPAALSVLQDGLRHVGADSLELNRLLLRVYLAQCDASQGGTAAAEQARTIAARHADSVLTLLTKTIAPRVSIYLETLPRRQLSEDLEVAHAHLQVIEGAPKAAIPALIGLAATITDRDTPADTKLEQARRAQLLIRAYAAAGLHYRAALASEDLVRLDPGAAAYRVLAAGEWLQSGDIDRAIRHFEAAVDSEPRSSSAWLGLAEGRLNREMMRPEATRDWKPVEFALKQARSLDQDSARVSLLEATVSLARGRREAAGEQLRGLLADNSLDPMLLQRVATLLEDAGDAQQADRALELYRQAVGPGNRADLASAEVLRRRGRVDEALALLEQAEQRPADDDRGRVLRSLATCQIEVGAIEGARRTLRKILEDGSRDFAVTQMAADLALLAGDIEELRQFEGDLQTAEGPEGTQWRYLQAMRQLEDRADRNAGIREAQRLLAEIEERRRDWSYLRLLRGRIADRQGSLEKATEEYKAALQTGVRSQCVFQWLVAALYKQNQFAAAGEYLRQLGPLAGASADLSSQAVTASIRAGRVDGALRLARAAAELRKKDVDAQLWYGQTLAMANNPTEAERVLRKALQLAPKDPKPWTGLVWLYGREGKLAEGRKTLQEMAQAVETEPWRRAVVLARGSEMLRDYSAAENSYREVLAARPNDARLLEEVGQFYSRIDYDKSLEMYRRALQIDDKSDVAGRMVAVLSAMRGTDAEVTQALEWLSKVEGPTALDCRRLEAVLLLGRRGARQSASQQQGLQIAKALVEQQDHPPVGDRLLLAKALEVNGQLDAAQNQFELVLKESTEPTHLVGMVEFLLRHDKLSEAAGWLTRLEERDPAGQRTLALRVDWLGRSQRSDQIEPTVERFVAARLAAAKTEVEKATAIKTGADLLTNVKLYPAAERKMRELAALDPAGHQLLAVWLAERGRTGEAVTECLQMEGVDQPQRVLTLIRILTIEANRTEHGSFDAAAAEELLARAEKADDVPVRILLELGVLRVMQGRDEEAIALYERARKKSPDDVAVMNNLALALSAIPRRQGEALTLIDQAVAARPNVVELLDTKALVLLGLERFEESRELLDRICRLNQNNSRYRLHLAMASYGLKDLEQSRNQMERARGDGLDTEFLTPSERRFVNRMLAAPDGTDRQATP